MKTNSRFLFAAAFVLAITFTFSCSEQPANDTNGNNEQGDNNQQGNNNGGENQQGNQQQPPATPTGLRVTLSSTNLQASWNAVAGASGYNLYFAYNSQSEWWYIPDLQGTSYTESDNFPAGTYYFALTAYNANGESDKSNIVSATITDGGTTTPSSSSRANTTVSSNSNATNGSVECGSYCKWDTGCVIISTDPTGEYGSVITTCAAAISNCTSYSPSKQTYANSTCTGGTTTPSSSSRANTTVSSNSNTAGGSVECNGYCKWDTGCVRISTDPTGAYGSVVATCAAAISNCESYSPSKQVYSNSTCDLSGNVTPGSSTSSGATSGTFTDSRDSRVYKWVKIGTQTWMAENLNYNASGSKCYNNSEANCTKYGRLYQWTDRCPSGWHIPSDAEWDVLVNYAGGPDVAGKKLKARSGWDYDNGTDDYGFAALPGGMANPAQQFFRVGTNGHWWSSTKGDVIVNNDNSVNTRAYSRSIQYNFNSVSRDIVSDVKEFFSVRCVKD